MAYRRTEGVEARLADNRSRILDAARRLVAEGGWADTQIASVAATGTVYRYFASKAELFAEVLALVSQREVDVLREIVQSAASPREGLHSAVATFVKRAMRNRRLAYALIAEPCEREIDAARLTWRHAISEQVLTLVRDGQREGSFRKGTRPEIAATVLRRLELLPDSARGDDKAFGHIHSSADQGHSSLERIVLLSGRIL